MTSGALSPARPPLARRDLDLPDISATAALARALAKVSAVGDVIALAGGLGAGKTTFARHFIAARGGKDEVPSPTFTLVQIYMLPGGPVWHFDLYRIEAPYDVYELGIEDALDEGISLIEWPERFGDLMPATRLDLRLDIVGDGARRAALVGHGNWAERVTALPSL